MNRTFLFLLPLIYLLIHSGLGAAHSVHVFAYQENGLIKGEGSLGGGRKVKNGEIQVFRASDTSLLLTTQTDDNGLFSFRLAQLNQKAPVDLLIVLNAGPGHRSEWRLQVELSEPTAASNGSAEHEQDPSSQHPGESTPSLIKIVAGVSFILGLGGVILFIRSRNGAKK